MGGSVSLEGKPSLPYCCIDIGHNVSASDLYACELTGREKEIVRITWDKLVERSEEMSVTLFLRIFELIPYTKQFFPFRDFVGDDLVKHPYFKGHGMRFINALRMAVLNMNAKEVILVPSLIKLGQRHANIQGFKHEYFHTFAQAMNDMFTSYLGRAYNDETKIAWNKIFHLIVTTVEQGYIEQQDVNIRCERQQNISENDDSGNRTYQTDGSCTCPAQSDDEGHIAPAQ